jgi:hypothetical protein
MRFKVLLHRRAYDLLKDLRSEDGQQVIDKLRQLEDFPSVRLDVVKVAGEADTFRLRVGSYSNRQDRRKEQGLQVKSPQKAKFLERTVMRNV